MMYDVYNSTCITEYDNQFSQIETIKKHDFLYPFVGKNYDEYRFLQIGESRFIWGCAFSQQEKLQIIKDWCNGLHDKLDVENNYQSLSTRNMVQRFLQKLDIKNN